MKIVSCYIENFGALQKYEQSFDPGFVMIHKENGTGKTTLSAFILAMLYGMDTHSQRDKEQKARNRYDPWQGGRYGGRLTIEVGGKIYRIERTFDTVSATKDKITVYDESSGTEMKLKDEPGVEFLGISKEAFLATAFLSGKEHGALSFMMPRLHGYLEGIEGTDRYDEAAKRLTDASKKYAKQRGSGGRIDDVKKQIKQANEHLATIRQASDNAEFYQQKLFDTEKTCLPKKKRLQFLNDHAAKLERIKVLFDYEQKAKAAKEEFDLFCRGNGNEFPEEDTFSVFEKDLSKIEEFAKKAEKTEKDAKTEEYLSKNKEHLGKLTKDDLEKQSQNIFELNTANDRLRSSGTLKNCEEYAVLHEKFEKDFPSDKEMELLFKINKDLEKTTLLYAHSEEQAIKKSVLLKKIFTLLCPISAVLFIIAAIAFAFEPVAAILLLVLALLSLAATIGVLIYRKKGRQNPYEVEFTKQSSHLKERLSSFGYDDSDLSLGLSLLMEDRKDYRALCKRGEEAEKQADELKGKAQKLHEHLTNFFAPFGHEEQPFSRRLDLLKEEYTLYTLQKVQADERETERALSVHHAKEGEAKLYARLSCYFKEPQGDKTLRQLLDDLKKKSQKYTELQSVLTSREQDLMEYRNANDLSLPQSEILPSPEEQKTLQEEISALEKEAATLRAKLEEELEKAAELPEAEAMIVQLHEKLDQLYDRKRILDLTAGFLKEAKDDLSNRYTRPIRTAYEEYTGKIDHALSEGLAISHTDMSLQFERNGALRKNENFNSAFLTLSNICMRLAMLKVAYPAERPFLVLDDPFVYLDDDNCKKALSALKELSADTQILYFTCHSGRTL